MSDDARRIFGSVPTGRRLEQADHDPRRVGTLGPLRRADEAKLRLARRNLREIKERDIEGQGLRLVEKSTGTEWEVVTSFVDLVDPKATGTTAFTVRDGWFVPLRPAGWEPEADESRYVGEIGGREATDSDPLPLPADLRIF